LFTKQSKLEEKERGEREGRERRGEKLYFL